MNLLITYGATDGHVPPQSVLVAYLNGKKVGAAAKLPGAEEDRWCVVPADVEPLPVHRDERDYSLVLGEPEARAALEAIATEREREHGGQAPGTCLPCRT